MKIVASRCWATRGRFQWWLEQLLSPKGLCKAMTVQEIQDQCQPGANSNLNGFLTRPSWPAHRNPWVRKLGSLMSTRGIDILLKATSEPTQSNERLRTSVPARLWRWRVACGWEWKRNQDGSTEHINRLELRAVLTAIKWRCVNAKQTQRRFLHLVDNLVSLHVVNKGRGIAAYPNRSQLSS